MHKPHVSKGTLNVVCIAFAYPRARATPKRRASGACVLLKRASKQEPHDARLTDSVKHLVDAEPFAGDKYLIARRKIDHFGLAAFHLRQAYGFTRQLTVLSIAHNHDFVAIAVLGNSAGFENSFIDADLSAHHSYTGCRHVAHNAVACRHCSFKRYGHLGIDNEFIKLRSDFSGDLFNGLAGDENPVADQGI